MCLHSQSDKESAMKYRAFLLFGAPGSGKGTQGNVIGQIPGFVHVSTGDLFRNLQVGSPLGRTFLEFSAKGQLVPDEFTVQLWRDYVEQLKTNHRYEPETDTLVLDGIPRSVAQAKILQNYIDVKRVYYLDCRDKGVMYLRLQKRALLENRIDDANEETIGNRLRVYEAETFPVLQQYPESIIRRIDTARSPVEVLADIVKDMAKTQAAKEMTRDTEPVLEA
jgi:adenylate kinase